MEYNIKTKTIDGIKLSWGEADILEVLIKMNGEPVQLKEIANQLDKKYKLIKYKTSVGGLKKQMFTLRKKVDVLIKYKPSFGYFIDEDIKISKETQDGPTKKTYEYGLVVGTKRERDYWKSKIKEKIEEIKTNSSQADNSYFMNDYKLEILEELLEGE